LEWPETTAGYDTRELGTTYESQLSREYVPLGGHGNLVTETCDLTYIWTHSLHTTQNPITNKEQFSVSNTNSRHQDYIMHFPGTFGEDTVVLITL